MTIIATYLSMFAVDDSFDAIQIKCDPEVSRGAFVFVDKCKPILFLLFAHNLLNRRTSFIAAEFEEQQRYNKGCLVKSFQSYGVIDRESDVHMTSFPLMSRVRVVFSLLWKVRVSYCDTDDVRSNEVRYAFYKSII